MGDSHRTCEICHIQERYSIEKLFYARFPLDENRCKQWVKVVGKEDLVHVPIEKLHALRHVCEKHFQKRDFTKTKTRLKKRAVPKLNLTTTPLTDNQLSGFPLHVAIDTDEDIPQQVEVEKGLFSWQQDSAVVPCDDVADQCLPPSAREELDVAVSDDELYDSSPPTRASSQSPSLELVAYRCNICSSEIVGFRYACVQCVDFDMCAACETRQAHAAHYMLRIPESRPCSEVEAKLRTIRRALVADGIVLVDGVPSELEIKEEVKDETSQEDPIELESTRPAASEESDHTSPAHSPPHTSLAHSPPHAPQINSPSNTTSTSTVPVLKIKTGNRLITSNATQPQQSQLQTLNVTHSRSILEILSSKPIVKIKKLDNFTVPLIKKIDKDALMRNLMKQNAGKRKVVVFPSTPEHRATAAQQNWRDTNPEGGATVHASSLQVPIPPKRPKIPSPRQTTQEHKK